jgi:hypothetical protein
MQLKGSATSLDGKTKIYTEVYTIELDDKGLSKKIETKYLRPDGTQFAQMTSDFSKSSTVPEINLKDSRFDRTESLTFNPTNTKVLVTKIIGAKIVKSNEVGLLKNMAAGQGFDNFVKINFEQLKNETVPISYGVLLESDFFSFKGYKKKQTGNVIQFGIKLSSFFLQIFSSELILEYDSQTKQILSYQGLSNLLTDDGKTQEVLIKYEVIKK